MNYETFINTIIDARGKHGLPSDSYFEMHHILPVCLGGEPTHDSFRHSAEYMYHENIIWLTPEEHFKAHELLALEHKDNKAILTAYILNSGFFTLDAITYAELKKAYHKLKSKAIICIELQEVFDSVTAAANKYSCATTVLSKCCKGRYDTACGYHWAYLDDLERRALLSKYIGQSQQLYHNKAVMCIETQQTYFSAAEAERITGISKSKINSCCKKAIHNLTATGYH